MIGFDVEPVGNRADALPQRADQAVFRNHRPLGFIEQVHRHQPHGGGVGGQLFQRHVPVTPAAHRLLQAALLHGFGLRQTERRGGTEGRGRQRRAPCDSLCDAVIDWLHGQVSGLQKVA